MTANRRYLGETPVSAIGLGGMLLSIEGRPEEPQAIATIRTAVEHGANLIDTADAYHATATDVGHNETLVASALESLDSRPLVATKGGRVRPGDGRWLTNASPSHLHEAARASLTRLGVDQMDLYQLHAPDTTVPFRESLLAIRDIVDAGLAAKAGVSNVNVDQLELAAEVLGDRLVSVQNQFSPTHRDSAPTVALAEQLGIAFMAWRPLGRVAKEPESPVGARFAEAAANRGVSVQRLVLAWHLATSPAVIPLVGVTRPETARDSLAALQLELSADEARRLAA